ncbi:TPA: DUF2971 domain-containing protein [Bacillus pacificus]
MGYDWEKWERRIKYRSDLGGYLYHLTKPEENEDGKIIMSALDRLLKIIKERKLNGSSTKSGFIMGSKKAICFQDAPIHGIVQNIVHEQDFRKELGNKVRYRGIGLAFPKTYIFKSGGRPVFYEKKEIAKNILPKDEWWRIVNLDLSQNDNIIDWTHEKEWRLPENEFHFDLSEAVVLLPNRTMYQEFIEECPLDSLKEIEGIVQLGPLMY